MSEPIPTMEEDMAEEQQAIRDIEAIAILRSDPHIDRVLNELSKLSGAAREQGDAIQYTYNKAWRLLRGGE